MTAHHCPPILCKEQLFKSHWIQDMGQFYGRNIFLAETSATTGGLDSLLQPTGTLKKAQVMAARAFGARQTFFVTNGTSTSNKIVLQALVQPGDIAVARGFLGQHGGRQQAADQRLGGVRGHRTPPVGSSSRPGSARRRP